MDNVAAFKKNLEETYLIDGEVRGADWDALNAGIKAQDSSGKYSWHGVDGLEFDPAMHQWCLGKRRGRELRVTRHMPLPVADWQAPWPRGGDFRWQWTRSGMDGNGGPGHPPSSFRPNHGAIVHFSTSWPPQALKKSAARPLRRVQMSTASALRASAGRRKTARSRGRRLFSTLSLCCLRAPSLEI